MLRRLSPTDRRWVVVGLVAAAIATTAWAGRPWGPRLIDLAVYRAGASALLHGSDIYSVVEPRSGLVFTYPVFAAIAFIPVAVIPLLLARVVVTLASLGALFAIVAMTVRQVRGTPWLPWSVGLSIAALAAHPVWDTLNFGQVNLYLVAMVLADIVHVRKGRGVLVGLATGIKLVPGVFIVYFLVTGQRRAALYSGLTALGTIGLGFIVQPGPAWDFWTTYAQDPGRTALFGVEYITNQSILGATARLLHTGHPSRILTDVLSVVVVAVALLVARRLLARGERLLSICVVAVAGLLASPISWSHHYVWGIPCLGAAASWARSAARGSGWRWGVVGAAAVVYAAGFMYYLPKEAHRELAHTPAQEVVANSYVWLAVIFLGWGASRALLPRPAVEPGTVDLGPARLASGVSG